LNTRDVFAIYRERRVLYEQATDKVRKSCLCNPGHVTIAFVQSYVPGLAQSLRFLR
jgi:hypothetical protein